MERLWPQLADIPLTVESYALEKLEAGERTTTHIRLAGDGHEGIGEEIGLDDEQAALQARGPCLPLAGEWTLESFCDHLATCEQWPEPAQWDMSVGWRNWAYESAALDLALRQAGLPLHEALGLTPRPLQFVNSLGLGDEPSFDPIRARLDAYPDLEFKIDAVAAWTPEIIALLAGTGAVLTVDFKGHYGLEVEDEAALLVLYERVLEAFPEAWIEDAHDLPAVTEMLQPHIARVSYDAPIRGVSDIESTPLPARIFNIKPCRIGSIRALLEAYAHCEEHGFVMYGGGMGELGVGRGQIQLLASLFHPDTPNDIAPSAYNLEAFPPDLPPSPLDPQPDTTGFRRATG